MTIIELTPPAVEPLTLVEIRAHLRLDTEDEDALLLALATVAREHLERETGLVLASRDFRLCLDDWPEDGILTIARGPVRGARDRPAGSHGTPNQYGFAVPPRTFRQRPERPNCQQCHENGRPSRSCDHQEQG